VSLVAGPVRRGPQDLGLIGNLRGRPTRHNPLSVWRPSVRQSTVGGAPGRSRSNPCHRAGRVLSKPGCRSGKVRMSAGISEPGAPDRPGPQPAEARYVRRGVAYRGLVVVRMAVAPEKSHTTWSWARRRASFARPGGRRRCGHLSVPAGSATGGASPQSGVLQRSSPSSAIPSANGVNPSTPPKLRLVTPAGVPRTRTAPPESPTST